MNSKNSMDDTDSGNRRKPWAGPFIARARDERLMRNEMQAAGVRFGPEADIFSVTAEERE
jgi:hypothetical protein